MKFWRRKLKWVFNVHTRSSRREFIQIISDLESGGDEIDDYDPITTSSPKTTRDWVVIFKKNLQAQEEQDIVRPNQRILSYSNSRLDWVIRFKEKLNCAPPWEEGRPWLSHCIFKVPENLRELEPMSYEPNTVSIGPYHRGKIRVKDMEPHKWRFLRQVLKRTKQDVELYLLAMSKLEQQTRQCYRETVIAMDSHEFIEMMLLDSCFVLEILRASSSPVKGRFRRYGYSKGDPIFNSPRLLPSIKNDMLKVENQLPLFVLLKLFKITSSPGETGSVIQLALHFFNSPVPKPRNHGPYSIKNMEKNGLHLLHVFRHSILPLGIPPDEPGNTELQSQLHPMIHSVTQLKNSGIKVRRKKSDVFMDIHYKHGLLEIPPLLVNSSTESIFLNLMAFEQCYPFCRNYVTSYANFMDRLINSTQDVEYLHLKGIIHHRLGSEEDVALLFNRLCRQIVFDVNDCYLSQVTSDVTGYLERSWPKNRATLKHEYFRHPWAVVSFFAAALLILLTFLQTFYAILGYHIPHS